MFEGKTFVWYLRKTIYAHTPFRILRTFFLLCFGHLFGVMVCSVCHFSCGKHIHKHPCLSVRLSVCLSVCPSLCEHVKSAITLVLYQMIRNTYWLWLLNFQGHMANFKVTRPKNLVKRVKLTLYALFFLRENINIYLHFCHSPTLIRHR